MPDTAGTGEGLCCFINMWRLLNLQKKKVFVCCYDQVPSVVIPALGRQRQEDEHKFEASQIARPAELHSEALSPKPGKKVKIYFRDELYKTEPHLLLDETTQGPHLSSQMP